MEIDIEEKVERFQAAAHIWAVMDQDQLRALLESETVPYWLFRYEDRDTQEVMLSAVKIERLSLVIEAMLMTAPPALRELMMQAFMRVAQRMAAEAMAGLTLEEQIALGKKGREIADAMLDKAMDPNGSRPQ
ncbi:MAG TPA: hypothetical protein VJ437_13115 [Acidiferrobacterales bacterium]|nr:hypothetical protein [Acidiferrobacterales bacterium]